MIRLIGVVMGTRGDVMRWLLVCSDCFASLVGLCLVSLLLWQRFRMGMWNRRWIRRLRSVIDFGA